MELGRASSRRRLLSLLRTTLAVGGAEADGFVLRLAMVYCVRVEVEVTVGVNMLLTASGDETGE